MSKKPNNYKIPSTVLGVTAFAITLMGAQNSWAAQFFSDQSSFVNALNSTLPSSLVNLVTLSRCRYLANQTTCYLH